ncbi:MAG: hypothetical protein GF331_01810 [Chitinivibrionales bacterium]|nr:hypothetical protein [Chitinivibrionales bacterium]
MALLVQEEEAGQSSPVISDKSSWQLSGNALAELNIGRSNACAFLYGLGDAYTYRLEPVLSLEGIARRSGSRSSLRCAALATFVPERDTFDIEDMHLVLNELLIAFRPAAWVQLTIGKYSLGWGYGMFRNPANHFDRERDPHNLDAVREGVLLGEITVSPFPQLICNLVLQPDLQPSSSSGALKLEWCPSELPIDLFGALHVLRGDDERFGLGIRGNIGPVDCRLEASIDPRGTREILRSDGTLSSKDGTLYSGIAGCSFLTRHNLFCAFEYYVTSGYSSDEWSAFHQLTTVSTDDRESAYTDIIAGSWDFFMRRNYAYLLVTQSEIFSRFSLQYLGIAILDDPSVQSTVSIIYQRSSIKLEGSLTHNTYDSEDALLGYLPNKWSGMLRLRYYF